MEVFVGPTFGIDVSSPPAYVMDPAQDKHPVASCLFLKEDGAGSEICVPNKPQPADESSDCSSSIGAPEDSDEDGVSSQGDADEVQSKFRGGSFSTLDSIEEALPIKSGLSNHFSGKSKSFTNLAEVSVVTDLKKKENPLNKRRRLLIASKWSRKSFYSWANPKSMPLLTLNEDEEHQFQGQSSMEDKDKEHDSHDEYDDEACGFRHGRLSKLHDRRLNSFKIRSCFSLADLQEHKES
ncbi:protein OXIDATIVE STRESS 3 LIKE 4-like [Humulus lupulus]|uniref:protein OXIDATIVE STRESS 3 LIKE 4-like n=1 Tax=Humulus lupulus TaxID=3486 RepID=UPI002B400CF7|nr:protein OXIDATIVE STRESS 3 LIKE 4-like [Humulus lupulus]